MEKYKNKIKLGKLVAVADTCKHGEIYDDRKVGNGSLFIRNTEFGNNNTSAEWVQIFNSEYLYGVITSSDYGNEPIIVEVGPSTNVWWKVTNWYYDRVEEPKADRIPIARYYELELFGIF